MTEPNDEYRVEIFASQTPPCIQFELITPDGFTFIADRALHPERFEHIAIADGKTLEEALARAMASIGSFLKQTAEQLTLSNKGNIDLDAGNKTVSLFHITNHNIVLPPWVKLTQKENDS